MSGTRIRALCAALLLSAAIGEAFPAEKPGKGIKESTNSDTLCESSCEKVPLLDSVINAHFHKYNFNGCILLAENGKIIYENAVGYSDFKTQTPMQENALFQLASVSKQFTAMAILILKERGLLSLDSAAAKYIPGFPFPDITVYQLLHHLSGLPEYVNGSAFDRYLPKTDTIRNRDLVDIMRDHHLKYEFMPGTRYGYSNTGYAMLSVIIENVSGMSYPDFMRKNIFQPLGMNNTYCYEQLASCPDDVCKVSPYKLSYSKTEKLNFITGDKGIFSCLHDMYLWDQSLYTDRLVSPQAIQEAFTPAVTNSGDTVNYGCGWRIYEEDGKRCIWHRGLWETFNPVIMRFVDDKKTIIILANIIPPYSCSRLLGDISEIWMPKEQHEEEADSTTARWK